MITQFKIAFRNLVRNTRRSLTIMLAVAAGTAGLLCFGQFIAATLLEFQSSVIRNDGHLSIFRKGYNDFGAANPTAYGLKDYVALMRTIETDRELAPLVMAVTPRISLYGIASNGRSDTSTTFFGAGIVPFDRIRMRQWDDYGLRGGRPQPAEPGDISDTDESAGVIGVGMARLLGVCDALGVQDCPTLPLRPEPEGEAVSVAPPLDLAALAARDIGAAPSGAVAPQIDLLTATAQGAPNIASLTVRGADAQAVRALDDSYVRMHFGFAQRLLFGRGEPEASSIAVQLKHTSDLERAKSLLAERFKHHGLALEIRDFRQLNPFYEQGEQFLMAIFFFISTIMGVIVLFMVVNTTSMTVMERVNEIGTSRALGVQRSTIRWQFALEGSMLGVLGATLGVILAQATGMAVNASRLNITIPGNSKPGPLQLMISSEVWPLMGSVWLVLVVVALLAALFPAHRGARMPVVDALRHV